MEIEKFKYFITENGDLALDVITTKGTIEVVIPEFYSLVPCYSTALEKEDIECFLTFSFGMALAHATGKATLFWNNGIIKVSVSSGFFGDLSVDARVMYEGDYNELRNCKI